MNAELIAQLERHNATLLERTAAQEIRALADQVQRLGIELRDTLAPDYEVGNLYRYLWDNDSHPGYVVYRHFDDLPATPAELARVHKVAAFVGASEAADYCAYRNEMQAKYGTDDVHAIQRPNVELTGAARLYRAASG